jgi:hypothetical protein
MSVEEFAFIFFMSGLFILPPIFLIVGGWLEKRQQDRF